MNGANPVKDNSMSQQRVWNSMCRSFVKCVAIHTGLGFDLWLKEEYEPISTIPTDENQKATDAQIKQINLVCDNHPNIDRNKWLSNNGVTWDTLTKKQAAIMLSALKQRYGDE